ncbi:hypothetical protein GCM10010307_82470 [Streptomyces vastus]|uniref:Uncharacterized protein n=1 Tax=Streptomyces vastus TaxID=285451 RepID=A0ABP6EAL2_9ACTN
MSAACSPPEPEPTPFATWNPARGVWETHPVNPACGHWACYSRTWPTSGTTRAGRAYAPLTSAPRTVESASSSLPGQQHPQNEPLLKTPTANLGSNGGSQHPDRRKAGGHGPTLADEIEHLLPTPKASDGAKGSPNQRHGDGTLALASTAAALTAQSTSTGADARQPSDLQKAAGHTTAPADATEHLLPTPTSADGNGGAGTTPKRKGGMNLRTAVTHLPTGGPTTYPSSADGNT